MTCRHSYMVEQPWASLTKPQAFPDVQLFKILLCMQFIVDKFVFETRRVN